MFGAMHCMRMAARVMTGQHFGSNVNMSSLIGLVGYPRRTAYCAIES